MAQRQPTTLGAVLRRQRRALALSQQELADRAGVSLRCVSDLERGVHATVRHHTLRLLAEALGVRPSDLCRAVTPSRADVPALLPLPPILDKSEDRPFFGRDRELARLGRSWDGVGDRGGFIVVVGEPGIGKTRLAKEAALAVQAAGGLVLAGRCDARITVPYAPFTDAVSHLVAVCPTEVLGFSRFRTDAILARLVPELATDDLSRQDISPTRAPLDPNVAYAAIEAALARVAMAIPVLLVLDDLHWADDPSVLVLRRLTRSGVLPGLLLLGIFRDDELSPTSALGETMADLRREQLVERIVLENLGASEVGAMIAHWQGAEVSPETASAIRIRTGGNPLFLRELLSQGTDLVVDPARARMVPECVRDVIARGLARLSEPANRALAVAAVVGQEFDVATVAAVSTVAEATLISALDAAVAIRIVEEVPGRIGHYRFRSGLAQQSLYEALGSSKRAWLHQRIGEVIEQLAVGKDDLDAHLPALSHHFARAHLHGVALAKAVDYGTQAGDRALLQGDATVAAQYYEVALEALERIAPLDERRICELLLVLGDAYGSALERHRARSARRRAAVIARSLDDSELLSRTTLGSDPMTKPTDVSRVDAVARPADRPDQTAATLMPSGSPESIS